MEVLITFLHWSILYFLYIYILQTIQKSYHHHFMSYHYIYIYTFFYIYTKQHKKVIKNYKNLRIYTNYRGVLMILLIYLAISIILYITKKGIYVCPAQYVVGLDCQSIQNISSVDLDQSGFNPSFQCSVDTGYRYNLHHIFYL